MDEVAQGQCRKNAKIGIGRFNTISGSRTLSSTKKINISASTQHT
jgi:hypothetical protein